MSLRTNLATRPFYNERVVQALLALAALVVAGMTVFNGLALLSLTSGDRALVDQAASAEARTRDLRRDVARTRTGIDATHVAEISAAAHEANETIDQRVFSWTELFNRLEAALPPNVRLDSVKPAIDDEGRLVVHVDVVARNVGAVEDFIDALEKTGAFRDLLSRQERENKEGLIEAAVQGLYDPAQAVKVSR